MRAALVDDRLAGRRHRVAARCRRRLPFPGLVEFDAAAMADAAVEAATTVLAAAEPPVAVGITNQRASTIVWDRATGEPIGPGIGWQDLRTVFDCIAAKAEHGVSLAPNQSITKLAWLLANVAGERRPRPVLRHRRHVVGLDADRRRRARHRPHQRRRHRPRGGADVGWNERAAPTPSASPCRCCRRIVDSCGDRRRGDGACREHRRSPRSSATSRRRSSGRGAFATARPRSRSASGGMLDLCTGTDGPGGAPPGRPRHLSDRRLVARRRPDVGHRGDHAVGRHQRAVAASRTSASSTRRRRVTTWRPSSATPTA